MLVIIWAPAVLSPPTSAHRPSFIERASCDVQTPQSNMQCGMRSVHQCLQQLELALFYAARPSLFKLTLERGKGSYPKPKTPLLIGNCRPETRAAIA